MQANVPRMKHKLHFRGPVADLLQVLERTPTFYTSTKLTSSSTSMPLHNTYSQQSPAHNHPTNANRASSSGISSDARHEQSLTWHHWQVQRLRRCCVGTCARHRTRRRCLWTTLGGAHQTTTPGPASCRKYPEALRRELRCLPAHAKGEHREIQWPFSCCHCLCN